MSKRKNRVYKVTISKEAWNIATLYGIERACERVISQAHDFVWLREVLRKHEFEMDEYIEVNDFKRFFDYYRYSRAHYVNLYKSTLDFIKALEDLENRIIQLKGLMWAVIKTLEAYSDTTIDL